MIRALVALGDVQFCEISPTLNLDVEWRLDKVDGLEDTVGDDPSIVARLNTPSYFVSLRITDSNACLGWSEDTEVVCRKTRENTMSVSESPRIIHRPRINVPTLLAEIRRAIEVWLTDVPIVASGGLVEPYEKLSAWQLF